MRSENVGDEGEEAMFVADMIIESEKLGGAESDMEVLGRVVILDADLVA